MKRTPNSNHVTETICNHFSGTLQVDAKYISVRPHEKKMAFIWAVDYYSHDIVWWTLASSENFESYYHLFRRLKSAGYQLKNLVCDDHRAIRDACIEVFPAANIQLCITHYKRNIQKVLDLKYNLRDRSFLESIKQLFASRDLKQFHLRGKDAIEKYHDDDRYIKVLADIDKRMDVLTTYLSFRSCPSTTNLIEGFNKHLASRLKSIDGFKSYITAVLWLNAYVFLRRTTPFRCCKGQFKGLNGKISLGITAKNDAPEIYFLREN